MHEDASQHTINNGENLTEGGRLDNVEIQARANSMVRDPEAEQQTNVHQSPVHIQIKRREEPQQIDKGTVPMNDSDSKAAQQKQFNATNGANWNQPNVVNVNIVQVNTNNNFRNGGVGAQYLGQDGQKGGLLQQNGMKLPKGQP